MNKKKLTIILLLIDIPIIIGVLVWFFLMRPPAESFLDLPGANLDEKQKYELAKGVGRSERLMWEAYYNGNHATIAKELVNVLQVQFGITVLDAASIADPLAKAAKAFAESTEGYEENVLPHLVTAYTQVQVASGMGFNPREVAAAELGWWVARRTPGQDDPNNVGKEIAKLYTAMYGTESGEILRAGMLRANAANKRDTNADNPPWDEIEIMLTEGYISLITGIMKTK